MISIESWKQKSVQELKDELETVHSYLCAAMEDENPFPAITEAANILAKLLTLLKED